MNIHLIIQSSRWMTVYLVILHLLVLIAFGQVLGYFALLVLGMLLVVSLLLSVWRFASDRSDLWVREISFVDNHWFLTTASGCQPVRLRQATVWQWLVLMNFDSERTGRCFSIQLFPDSCDKESLRRLRVILRHLPVC